MKVYFDQKDQTWAQAQFNYGDWSGIAFSLFDTTMVPTDIYGWSFESRVMELTLTQEILIIFKLNKEIVKTRQM